MSPFTENREYWRSLFLSILLAVVAWIVYPPSASATGITWTASSVGTGSSGSVIGTYNITGTSSNAGIGGTSDSCFFYNTPVTGNVEIIGQVTSQTNTGTFSNYAVAGLMIRDTSNANGMEATVGVSPANGVNFFSRPTDGAATTTTLGPSIAAPVWLRLVVSGTSVAGYQSSDGISWSLVGKSTMTLPSTFQIGLVVASNIATQSSTADFSNVNILTSVPQRTANMLLWLRGDVGVQYSGSNVTGWLDQSGNSMNATGTSGNEPTLVTSGINGLPALNFVAASNQYLQLGSGFSNFSSGCTMFVVTNISTIQGGYTQFLSLSSGGVNNGLMLSEPTTTTAGLQEYTSTGGGPYVASQTLSTGSHMIEAVQSGTTATAYVDGVAGTPNTSMTTIPNNVRSANYIAKYNGSTAYNLNGKIAEIIVYNTALTTAQRQSVENYLNSKYSLTGTPPTLAAPAISPQYASAATTQTVTITPPPGAVAYYQLNGGTPTLYTGPFPVTSTSTISAIASAPGFNNSSATTGKIEIDPLASNVLQSNLQLWLRADLGAPASGSLSTWSDISGNQNNASQSVSADQPTITTGPNGLPAVNFSGSQWLSLASSTGFSNLTQGASVFIVTKPAPQSSGNYRMLWLGQSGTTNNQVGIDQTSSTQWGGFVYNGGTASSIVGSGLSTSSYQVLDEVYNGSNTLTLFSNSGQTAQSTAMQTAQNISRIGTIGSYNNGTSVFFTGAIAEIILYNSALSPSQRLAVEGYLAHKYALYVNAPTISPTSGMYYVAPQTVTITADPGAQIRYTVDGSTPTTSSILYTGPFHLNGPAIVQAIAVQSFGNSSVTTSTLGIDTTAGNVPTSGLQCWLRSDTGVFTSGSSITQWTDMSGNANSATQSSSSNRPTLVTAAVGGLPAVNFSSTSPYQYFNLPSGFSSLSSGVSVFCVAKPLNPPTGAMVFLAPTAGSATNAFSFHLSGTAPAVLTNNGTTSTTLTASAVPQSFELLEAFQNGASTATICLNGSQIGQNTSMSNLVNGTRSANAIGSWDSATMDNFYGQMAEVLIYNRQVSIFEQASIEAYLLRRYSLSNVAAPTFSIASGTTLSIPAQVAVSGPTGAALHVTLDGTTPTTTSQLYTGPISVQSNLTIKALAVVNGISSSVSSATYTLDSTQWPAPSSSDPNTPAINLHSPTPAQ